MSDALTVRVGCEFRFGSDVPTPAVFCVQPRVDESHEVLEDCWEAEPDQPRAAFRDLYTNSCHRVTLPAGSFRLVYDALVEVPGTVDDADLDAPEVPTGKLPDDLLVYTLPSRYCLSDELGDVAWQRFGSHPPGYRRVQAISEFVHGHLAFGYGSSDATTTALDAYEAGRGVCRDFAHLGIALCRAVNIPARYVFGYLPDIGVEPPDAPMDFCAWFEAWLGDRWYTFDPRNNQRRAGRVVIGRGRDAVDVAMVTTFGGPRLEEMRVWADEVKVLSLR